MITLKSIKAKRFGRPPTGHVYFGFRAPEQLANAIDAFTSSSDTQITRSEAIRCILNDWLRTHGLLGIDDVKPTGPATEVIRRMDAEIEANRRGKNRKRNAV